MAEQEPQKSIKLKKRHSRTRLIVLFSLLFLLLITFLGVFLGFNYFGERILRKYLQEKIRVSSDGLYRADFSTLHVNILTGKVEINNFELIPDTLQYQRLKSLGKVASSLYQLSFSSLTIDKVHFRQIYSARRINFRQLTLLRPVLSIVGYRDTSTALHNRWRVIYEDIYPAVSSVFKDFHVDSVVVDRGRFLSKSHQTAGRETSGEYEFNAILRDVLVNRFSYYNHARVFYSRDVDLIVHNVEYMLADSLYVLKAEELGFSLTKSRLYGKKLSLLPNFKAKKKLKAASGDFFRLDLPGFSIQGIDLYRAMTNQEVQIHAVKLNDFFVRVYRKNLPPGTATNHKTKKKINLAGLYTIVAKELRYVSIDSLLIKNASFEFFANLTDKKPELRIGKVNLDLNEFRLDSVSYMDPDRIFYAHGLELSLDNFSLFLRDGIHYVNASSICFSTRKSLIDVSQCIIFPGRQAKAMQQTDPGNTMDIRVPRLTFTGIDMKRVFNNRIFDFDRLAISEPEIRYTRFRPPKNPDPRFKKPEDFFEEQNGEVVYDLLKKYLWIVKGREIEISNGFCRFSTEQNGSAIPLASCSFSLTMQQFLIDSVHGMNQQGYFYSQDFDLDLNSLSIVSPDSLSHLQANRVHIVTRDSLIEANNVEVFKTAGPLKFNAHPAKRQSLTFDFSLKKLQLTGLNHKKLFLENVVKANQIILENPVLHLKSNNNVRPEGTFQASQLLKTTNFVRTFEIGRCIVKKGTFSYDGEEDRKASYFSLKDIDFAVLDATVHLPQKGYHDGLIKFDSLQLKVIPLRAIIADSTYELEARSLEVHSYPADIILKGIRVSPLKRFLENPDRKIMTAISIPEIRFNGFYFDRAIFDNQWLLDTLYVDHPSVSVEIWQDEMKAAAPRQVDPASFIKIPPFMNTLSVHKVSILGADAGLIIHRLDKTRSYALKTVMVTVTRFQVDSATRANPAGTPLFNADDISVSAPGFSWMLPDSMYTCTIGRFGFSTGSASVFLDTFTIIPNYSRIDFARKVGYQTNRIVFKVPRITVSKLDFRKLVSDRYFHAVRVNLDGVNLEAYCDKRLLFPEWRRPLMPGQMIAGIKFPASIDTISLSNGFACYEEQKGDEPGRIFFDRMNATLTGFITLSGFNTLNLYGTSRLMGLAPTESWFQFQTRHDSDSFTLHSTVGELDLTAINPMLSKLLPVAIKRGTATMTEIVQMNANNEKATGRLIVRYNNLAIRLYPTKPGTWNNLEQSLLTEVVNFILPESNPGENGKTRQGEIYFERDLSKGFFNFVWKSSLSGLKSTMGINSKAQKEMIRGEKKNK